MDSFLFNVDLPFTYLSPTFHLPFTVGGQLFSLPCRVSLDDLEGAGYFVVYKFAICGYRTLHPGMQSIQSHKVWKYRIIGSSRPRRLQYPCWKHLAIIEVERKRKKLSSLTPIILSNYQCLLWQPKRKSPSRKGIQLYLFYYIDGHQPDAMLCIMLNKSFLWVYWKNCNTV